MKCRAIRLVLLGVLSGQRLLGDAMGEEVVVGDAAENVGAVVLVATAASRPRPLPFTDFHQSALLVDSL